MFPDHPAITATASTSAPNRQRFIHNVSQLHAHPVTMIVSRNAAPGEAEPTSFTDPWASRIGDGASHVASAL